MSNPGITMASVVPKAKQSASRRQLVVRAHHDHETGGWWAESDDIPGLVTEAPSFDALVERVTAVAPDLCKANGVAIASGDTLRIERDKERATMTRAQLDRALSKLGKDMWNALLNNDSVMDALDELANAKLDLDGVNPGESCLSEDAALGIFGDGSDSPNIVRSKDFVRSKDWAKNSLYNLALNWVVSQAVARMQIEHKFASEVGKNDD